MDIQIDTEDVLTGKADWIEYGLAERLSRPSLDCIEKEFPHYIHSIDSEGSFKDPKEKHPIFFGCYDWHSSVHSHWDLIRQVRLIDDHPLGEEIIERLDEHFTERKVKKEVEFFKDNRRFEKPYGWGWFLRLMSELYLWDEKISEKWEDILQPLEEKILELTKDEFLEQERPFRVGTHGNSAFSLLNMLDHARVKSVDDLESKIIQKSKAFYLADKDSPVQYEPIGWDFLSPTLTEADLMRRILDEDEFIEWLDGFLPDLNSAPYRSILEPIKVELDELMKYHLVGLNISKAWCLIGIDKELPQDHRYKGILSKSAGDHAEEGLKQAFSEDYGGSHWLLSYALYLFTSDEEGIDP